MRMDFSSSLTQDSVDVCTFKQWVVYSILHVYLVGGDCWTTVDRDIFAVV